MPPPNIYFLLSRITTPYGLENIAEVVNRAIENLGYNPAAHS
jgi:hypothetical protein